MKSVRTRQFARIRLLAVSLVCLGAVGLASAVQACGSSEEAPAATDSGVADTKKPTTVDSGGPPTEELTVLKSGMDVPADLTCMGGMGMDAGMEETGGGDAGPGVGDLVDVPFKVIQFGGGGSDIVVGADVDLFYANTLQAGGPSLSGKTDAMGLVTLKIPHGKLFTYRVNANAQLRAFVYFDSDAVKDPSKTYELTAITESKYNQFALAITGKTGFLTAAGTGIFSGRVQDCRGDNIRNAVIELVDADTGAKLPTGAGDAELKEPHYLSDNDLPSQGRVFTSRSGLVATINVPETKAGGKKLKAIAKGLYGGSKELRKFAEADLEITATAVNFRAIVPR